MLLRGYEQETRSLINLAATKPTNTRALLIDKTIRELKNCGFWGVADLLYLAGSSDDISRLNWIRPGTFTLADVVAPTFTPDRGFKGNGTTQALDTGFNPTTAGGKFALGADQHMGLLITDNVQNNSFACGYLRSSFIPRGTTNITSARSANSSSVQVQTSMCGERPLLDNQTPSRRLSVH
jgi:hypothetical protein